MNTFIPVWIIGGPFLALLALSFLFKGSSSMSGNLPRPLPRNTDTFDPSAPLLDPVAPGAPRRFV